jgi:glucose dehydrogenase
MFEDVEKAGLSIADANMEGKYFKHYGGMSWRWQSYDPSKEDTDIDFGGTHPHKQLYDIGKKIAEDYERETSHLKSINNFSEFFDE